MKDKIKIVVCLLLILLLVIFIVNGIKIGDFQILSITNFKNKNQELENRIENTSELTSVKYPEAIGKLEKTYEEYNIQKQKYEEISGFTKKDKKQVYETKQYDISYLWEKMGKYATKNNLKINMNVKQTKTKNMYNLEFEVLGEYVNISEFVKYLENNSDFAFRINKYKMVGNENSEVVSSIFIVENVRLNSSTLTNRATIEDTEKSK